MIAQYGHSLAKFLQAHPNWGGLITFLVAFLESLVVVGTVIPGSVTMSAVGMLIGSSILPLCLTLAWATLGAFTGDLLGYWLGIHYNERLRQMWPFVKHPQWLTSGEKFFHKHGGKSILIGRFVGPLRSIIPLIAGLLHMKIQKFFIAALPSAFLWAIAYMLPGILLGALSLQLPPKLATQFILWLFLIIILLSACAWLTKVFSSKIRSKITALLKETWCKLEETTLGHWLCGCLATEKQTNNYKQLGWFFAILIMLTLFIIVSVNVIYHTELTFANKPLFEFLRSLRTEKIDYAMIGITLLGDGRIIILSTLLIIAWLMVQGDKFAMIHWTILLAIAITLPNIMKHLIFSPRPTGLMHISSTSSYPSGHTLSATLFYGFLAFFIANHLKLKYRRYAYHIAIIMILLVGFSRVYLGAHWLTDILGSLSLGIAALGFVFISYRRKKDQLNISPFIIYSLVIIPLSWVITFTYNFHKSVNRYSLQWPSQVIDQTIWWKELNPALPIYRMNRLGKPAEPMNIQFSGDINQLRNNLLLLGWKSISHPNFIENTIQKLSQTSVNTYLPSLYLNKQSALYMVQEAGNLKLVLRLWQSNVYLAETWDIIYIGNITEYCIKKDKIIYSFNTIYKIMPYIKPDEWRTAIIHAGKIPDSLFDKKWNGEILQISAPTLY